ncbi:MAG TPA: DUF2142 domain-containing protein, partial [Ilumatobacteraceae bacterium]
MSRFVEGNRFVAWLSATCAFAIIACTWAMATARYGGPDEPAHIIRAAAVSHGDLVGDAVRRLEPGYRQVSVAAALATGDPGCFRHDEDATAACTTVFDAPRNRVVATSAGTAPPWYYLAVGWTTRALSSGRDAMGFRIASVLLCAAILGYALARCIAIGRAAWLLAAITPSAWFLFGVVGTSGVEVALISLALVEGVARFQDRGASLMRVAVPLALCLMIRPASVIDIAVVGLVVAPTLRPITRRTMATIAVPLAMAALVTVAWNRWTGLVVRDDRTADTDSLAAATWRSLRGIPTTAHQAVGALGWNEFFAPHIAQLLWIAVLAFAVYWTATRTPDRWWHVRWMAFGLLLPTVMEVALHHRIGEVWQGRYSIPFAMAGVLYAARAELPARSICRALVVSAAAAQVLTLWNTIRRYTVGLHGSLTFRHATWTPPLNPWLLLLINAAAMAWLTSLALNPVRSVDDVAE